MPKEQNSWKIYSLIYENIPNGVRSVVQAEREFIILFKEINFTIHIGNFADLRASP